MIKLEKGEWYIFPHDKRSINQHPLLDSVIRSIRWDENGMGIGYYDLPANLKDVYFNVKSNEFKFKNRILILGRQTVSGVCADYFDSPQNKPGKRKISETLDDSFNFRKCKPSIHQQSSTGINEKATSAGEQTQNAPLNTNTTPTSATNNASSSNPLPPSAPQPSASNSTPVQEKDLERFDLEIHNVRDYIDRFEKKYEKVASRNKFKVFAECMADEKLKTKVMRAATKRITWKSFSESFAKDVSDQHLSLITKLNTEKFELGRNRDDLIQFVKDKFQMYDKILIGVPENVQIIQIITLLPEEYSKNLYFNLDYKRDDFIEKLQYFDAEDEEDESEDFIDNSKQPNLVNNTQSTTCTEVKNQKNSVPTVSSVEMSNQNSKNSTIPISSQNALNPVSVAETVQTSNQRKETNNESNDEIEIDQVVTIQSDEIQKAQNGNSSTPSQDVDLASGLPLTPPPSAQSSIIMSDDDLKIPTKERHFQLVRWETTYELIVIDSDEEEDYDQLEIARHRAKHQNDPYLKKAKFEMD